MKKVVESDVELTVEERNLLSVAYKNKIGQRRASWRILCSCEDKAAENKKDTSIPIECKQKVEKELIDICKDILELLEKYLIDKDKDSSGTKESKAETESKEIESKVFFLKM